jgi:hypothetical protein
MEPEGSLPSSQELSTCTYPEPETFTYMYIYKFNRQGMRILGVSVHIRTNLLIMHVKLNGFLSCKLREFFF